MHDARAPVCQGSPPMPLGVCTRIPTMSHATSGGVALLLPCEGARAVPVATRQPPPPTTFAVCHWGLHTVTLPHPQPHRPLLVFVDRVSLYEWMVPMGAELRPVSRPVTSCDVLWCLVVFRVWRPDDGAVGGVPGGAGEARGGAAASAYARLIYPLSCQSCVGRGLVLGGGDAGWCGGAREHVRVGRLLGELTTRTPTPATHSRARHARSSSIDRMERMPL